MSTEVRALIKCETQADGIRVKQVLEGLRAFRVDVLSPAGERGRSATSGPEAQGSR